MEYWFIIVLVAASAIGYFIMLKALRKAAITKQQYEEFAKQHHWQYQYQPGTRNTPQEHILSDPSDDWKVVVSFMNSRELSATDYSTSSEKKVEWRSPRGALSQGQAVLASPLPEKTVKVLQGGGAFAKQMLTMALKGTSYAIGRTNFNLQVHEQTAGHPSGMVLSSQGQEAAMDIVRKNVKIRQNRANNPKKANIPVVIRDSDGLTVRQMGDCKDLNELYELVMIGKSLLNDFPK